ncbi:MAG TPA: DNA primase [Candidatus Onthocola stercoravium]|nr:DNA primase [Candidatus Onthocola stercoravium]
MAYIKDEELSAILERADIVDIISDYLSLKQRGKNYLAVCPFHDDHSPSLVVSRERQIFNCFTCRTGGNVFTFVMKYENVGFVEAVKIVADKIGYNLNISDYTDHSLHNKDDYEIMDFAKKYYLNNIFTEQGVKARKYLENRGIDEAIIREFNIGLSLSDKDTLYKVLSNKKYDLDKIANLGLVNKVGLDIYDVFTNRIMIPIEDLKGQVVGFTGRIFNNETDTAKYMNTKETEIFKKGHILFNYHNARKSIRDAKEVVVVEGNMDAITLSAKGIKNVVALMGVALSTEQINVLKKLKVPVILMLDNDSAGMDATVKNGELLQSAQIDTRVVRLTGAKDPDEYIRLKGVNALKDNIKHALKYIDFKLEYLKNNKNLNNMEDLIEYVKEVIFSLNSADDLTKELVISKISKDYEIDAEILKQELKNDMVNKTKKVMTDTRQVEKPRLSKYDIAVSKILFSMMCDPTYITIYKNRLGYFKEKKERTLVSEIVYYNNVHNNINLADFITYVMPQEDLSEYVNEIINLNSNTVVSLEEFNSCVDVVLEILKKDEIKELKEKIKKELDVNKKVELIARLTELKKEV